MLSFNQATRGHTFAHNAKHSTAWCHEPKCRWRSDEPHAIARDRFRQHLLEVYHRNRYADETEPAK